MKGKIMAREAFFGEQAIKQVAIDRAKAHLEAGRIIQGDFGKYEYQKPGTAEFRGCAVGCLAQPLKDSFVYDGFMGPQELKDWLNNNPEEADKLRVTLDDRSDTDFYGPLKKEFNFSENLSAVIDAIFEALPEEEAKNWPSRIIDAIPVGANVSNKQIKKIVAQNETIGEVLDDRFDWASGIDLPDNIDSLADVVPDGYVGQYDPEQAADDLIAALQA
jgi:hypothetical protein